MFRDGKAELIFGGDARIFRLGIDELLSLEDRCDSALADIAMRLALSRYKLRDITETLRLGLIGGGMEGSKAKRLVEEQVASGRIQRHAIMARIVLNAALMGEDIDTEGKPEDAAEAPGDENVSPPASSSATVPLSDSPPRKLDA